MRLASSCCVRFSFCRRSLTLSARASFTSTSVSSSLLRPRKSRAEPTVQPAASSFIRFDAFMDHFAFNQTSGLSVPFIRAIVCHSRHNVNTETRKPPEICASTGLLTFRADVSNARVRPSPPRPLQVERQVPVLRRCRCAQLYYRRGAFGCRVCHGLTYRSCQRPTTSNAKSSERNETEAVRANVRGIIRGIGKISWHRLCFRSSLRAYVREPR